jgi:hypothetical protein
MKHGGYIGTLRDSNHKPIKIDGLWGLAFGDGAAHQPVNTLSSRRDPTMRGRRGLYGRIDAQPGSALLNVCRWPYGSRLSPDGSPLSWPQCGSSTSLTIVNKS